MRINLGDVAGSEKSGGGTENWNCNGDRIGRRNWNPCVDVLMVTGWGVLRMGKGKIHPLMDGVTQPTMNACFTGTIAEFREFLEGMRQICAMIQK